MAAGALWWYWRPGPLPQATAIVIPHGGLAGAGAVLQREDALPDGPAALFGFRVAGRLTRSDGPVHAAEFEFPAHASVRELLLVLRTARPVQHQLTIPEGLTVAQIALLLASADALAGATPVVAEGSILPETYAYERGTTRAAIVTRMQAAMERRLQSAWTSRQPQPELPTPRDLLVLASLVERETARPAERPLVARVFLNRLHLGIAAAIRPDRHLRGIRRARNSRTSAQPGRSGAAQSVQQLPGHRPATRADLFSRPGRAGCGGAPGRRRHAVFRRRRQRRPCLCHRPAHPTCRTSRGCEHWKVRTHPRSRPDERASCRRGGDHRGDRRDRALDRTRPCRLRLSAVHRRPRPRPPRART